MEGVLLTWLKKVRAAGVNVDRSVLRENVDNIALFVDIQDFQASGGWLHQFKARNRLAYKIAASVMKNTGRLFFYVSDKFTPGR